MTRSWLGLVFPVALLACGSKAVELDAGSIEPSNDPNVLGIVRERLGTVAVDDQRLYWTGTYDMSRVGAWPQWALRSCKKADCASSLVSYEGSDVDASLPFIVSKGEIFWFQGSTVDLVGCAITGCGGAKRTVAANLGTSVGGVALDATGDGVYYSSIDAIYWASLSTPDAPKAVITLDSSRSTNALTVHGDYIYWLLTVSSHENSQLPETNTIERARTDGSGSVETVASDLELSRGGLQSYGLGTPATPQGRAFVLDGSSLYWGQNTLSGSLQSCPLAGCAGAPQTVAGPLRAPTNLLIDGSTLYWQFESDAFVYSIQSCTLPDCVPSTPIVQGIDANVLAVDDQYVYTATTDQSLDPSQPADSPSAQIRRFPKSGESEP